MDFKKKLQKPVNGFVKNRDKKRISNIENESNGENRNFHKN